MKNLFLTALYILMLGMGSAVKAQFDFTHYNTHNCSLPSDYILGGVAVDNNNNKWFGTESGVVKFDGTTWTVFTTSDGLPDNYILCIAVDKNNNVWVGTDGFGVAKYNGSIWTTYTVTDGLCDNGIHYIAGDTDGSVWFASWSGGVSKYNGSTWITYTTELPLDNGFPASVNYITVDAFGNKWFGTDMGLSKFDGTTWTTFDTTTAGLDSLIDMKILTIAIDSNNNKWLGTFSGITQLSSTNTWVKNYRFYDNLKPYSVEDIDIDSKGNIWLGLWNSYTFVGNISKYDGTSWVSNQTILPTDSSQQKIFRLAVDNNDIVWIAMDYGVYKLFDASGIRNYSNNSSFNVYPNPTSDVLNIELISSTDLENQNIEIYNTLQKVGEYEFPKGTTTFSIPIEKYTQGLYFIRYGNITKKIIIEN